MPNAEAAAAGPEPDLDLDSALAAFEAEISAIDASAASSQPCPAAGQALASASAKAATSEEDKLAKWKNVRHRAVISEPARVAAPSAMSSAAAAAKAAPAPYTHTYSSAYSQEMQAKYDELQNRAKEFQAQSRTGSYAKVRKGKIVRAAAGQQWTDDTLLEWPENDFRLFAGDLGNEVTDDTLTKTFSKFPSFAKARVVKDKKTGKTRGYGFVSFLDANDYANAFREFNGKYIGNRPVKLRKSKWTDRNIK